MARYIAKRLLLAIPVILGATFILFAMVYALPGDPVRALAGDRHLSEGVQQALIHRYHLDEPLLTRYQHYLEALAHGDLGTDLAGREVKDLIAARFPNTLRLALIALVFETVIGITLGGLAGLKQGGPLDLAVLVSTILVIAIPVVVLAFSAQYIFGLKLGWFPVSGVYEGLKSYLLPGLMLGARSLAYVARLTRATVAENVRNDYVRTARAKGLAPRDIFVRHTLRNSLIPVVTFIGADLGGLLGGAVITEGVFNIPGIGQLLFQGVQNHEGPVVVGVTTMIITIFIVSILIVDVVSALLDPRIRYE